MQFNSPVRQTRQREEENRCQSSNRSEPSEQESGSEDENEHLREKAAKKWGAENTFIAPFARSLALPKHLSAEPTHQYNLRSTAKGVTANMMPLLDRGPSKPLVYQPFMFTDMNCIPKKMPPPTEGDGPWMAKFCQLTMGHQLALGDWRALLGRQVGDEVKQ